MDNPMKDICALAIYAFGAENQKRKLVQEIGELLVAMTRLDEKRDTREHVAEEIADVAIVLNQMILLYDCEEMVTRQIRHKLDRLRERIRQANNQ